MFNTNMLLKTGVRYFYIFCFLPLDKHLETKKQII